MLWYLCHVMLCYGRSRVCYVYVTYVLCMFCVCFVYVLCMFCVFFVYFLCIFCVYFVYILCMFCLWCVNFQHTTTIITPNVNHINKHKNS